MQANTLPPIKIQPATWRDVRTLVQLDRRCFNPIDTYSWYEFLYLCAWPGHIALKAVVAERLAGLIVADPRQQEGHTIIVTLAVDPNYQRHGIGERLLREVETRSAQRIPRLQLMVRTSNLPALRLYHKLDYAIVETWPRYYEDGEDAYVMEKSLTSHPLGGSLPK